MPVEVVGVLPGDPLGGRLGDADDVSGPGGDFSAAFWLASWVFSAVDPEVRSMVDAARAPVSWIVEAARSPMRCMPSDAPLTRSRACS